MLRAALLCYAWHLRRSDQIILTMEQILDASMPVDLPTWSCLFIVNLLFLVYVEVI